MLINTSNVTEMKKDRTSNYWVLFFRRKCNVSSIFRSVTKQTTGIIDDVPLRTGRNLIFQQDDAPPRFSRREIF